MNPDHNGPSPLDFAHFFDYLVLARATLFTWVAERPADTYARAFPFGLGSIRATLLHVADIEWGYVERLSGRDYVREDSPFTATRHPTLHPFMAAWDTRRPATRGALAAVCDDPGRLIEYVSRNFSPPRPMRTTAGGIAWQMLFHEVHHRAQVMSMLRLAGVPAQDLDYRRLMWDSRR